jgi:hypothetical protein
MGHDLHARVQTLARVRRGRIGISDCWDGSGGTARDNYLTNYPLPAGAFPTNSAFTPIPQGKSSPARDQWLGFHLVQPAGADGTPCAFNAGLLRLAARGNADG